MLHIVGGESAAGTLRESSRPGEVLIYGDLLYEGSTPAGLNSDTWDEIRVRFYSDAGYANMEDARFIASFVMKQDYRRSVIIAHLWLTRMTGVTWGRSKAEKTV